MSAFGPGRKYSHFQIDSNAPSINNNNKITQKNKQNTLKI